MPETTWWKHGIVYQIYPRSFQDTDGDGIGDLEGIRRRLDHLAWLGVDAVWVSPIYPSPMADFGYDVADYCGIDPMFGTMDDFDRLVGEIHARGLKLILDFVPNHTSDQHPWFQESRRSRSSPKRDWYIWRDAAPDGGPPNNWNSNFGGSGWEWDEATGQYYYHAFLKEQPDLNWRNPEVQAAMHDVLRFWMRRGVDGFRVDVIWHLMKDATFRDNPPNPAYDPSQGDINKTLQVYSTDQPEVHDIVAGMRSVLEEFDDRVLIGEIYLPVERLVAYYGENLEGAHLPFNFQLIHMAWDAGDIAALVEEYEAAIPKGGWPNWVLGNHDQTRIAGRVGPAQARVAAMLLLTLRGTPTMYYGDEIGIGRVEIPPGAVQDPWEKNEPGLGLGRDPQRTPMQWEGSLHAGFTTGRPWLPVAPNATVCNVAALAKDQGSILTLYRRLIEFRRRHPALSIGSYVGAHVDGKAFAYERRHDGERLLIALNFCGEAQTVPLPDDAPDGRILLSTALDRAGEPASGEVGLRPDEGLVIQLE
ncbi:alpha-amylase family glycosyl hydrolase [Geminicoccus roseus]|uniref:alpha-amylase family glycosyl hydrolase n=1 Tax=Geminicoccus roseus TaxID=404900 RepID=UPI0003F796B7|nr:alpha-amylase family glycosyl hydrolase [Geminicoccus roseus]